MRCGGGHRGQIGLFSAGLIKTGSIEIETAHGHKFTGGDGSGAKLALRCNDKARTAFLMLDPELNFGGLYIDGRIEVTQGTISDVLMLAAANMWRPESSLWVRLLPTAQRRLARPLRAWAPGLAKLVGVLDGSEKSDGSEDNPLARATDLMKTGIALIATCMIVYLGTFREPVSGAILPSFLQGDLTASGGLLLLGPPVVVLAFVLFHLCGIGPELRRGRGRRRVGLGRGRPRPPGGRRRGRRHTGRHRRAHGVRPAQKRAGGREPDVCGRSSRRKLR